MDSMKHYSTFQSQFIEMFGNIAENSKQLPQKKLGEVATLLNGRAYKANELLSQGKYIVLRVGNFFTNSDYYYSDMELESDKYCDTGDLLYSWSATLGAQIWSGGKVIYHYHIWKVVFDEAVLNKKYFCYMLNYMTDALKQETHGSTMVHLTKEGMEKKLIVVPSMEVQNKFSSILDQADKSKFTRLKSQFIEMFGDPVKNSKNLKQKDLSTLGKLERGVSKFRPRNAPELLDGPYPLVQTGDIANSDIYITRFNSTYSELGLKQSKLWPSGTLCITIAANIAKTGILTFDACFPDSIVGFIPEKNVNILYIHFWFKMIQQHLESLAPSTAQKNINLSVLSGLKVICPSFSEQNKFSEILSQADKSKYIN